MAADANYCYSFEVNILPVKDTYHRLYRISKALGSVTEMKNVVSEIDKTQVSDENKVKLSHANDVALATFGGKNYMYVATLYTKEIVKLGYDSSGKYWYEASYGYTLSGQGFNGLSLMDNTDPYEIKFLAQADNKFYTIIISRSNNGTASAPVPAFTIDSLD